MDNKVKIHIDGKEYQVLENKKLVDAAKENGIYIPTLCHFREIEPSLGTCRICTVMVNGKFTTSCTTKVKEGMECGMAFENYDGIKENDVIECYEIVEEARTLD